MFGLFESDANKAKRLFDEFQSYLGKISLLSEEEQTRMSVALGGVIVELEKSIGNPLAARGEDAKRMANQLRATAKNFSPQLAICYKLLATSAEAASISHPIAVSFRQGAEQLYLGAELSYRQYLDEKKR